MRHAPGYHPIAFYLGLNIALAALIGLSIWMSMP
jgi:hypothetical protein